MIPKKPHRAGHPLYFKVFTGHYLMILSGCWSQGRGISASFQEPVLATAEQKSLLFIDPHKCSSKKQLQLQIDHEEQSRNQLWAISRVKFFYKLNSGLNLWPCSRAGSQTRLWLCIWGWEEASSSFFSSLALPRPGWEGSLGWAGHSFNPGKAINTNPSLKSPQNRTIFLLLKEIHLAGSVNTFMCSPVSPPA